MRVALIDYDSGNLHSAEKAFQLMGRDAGADIIVTDTWVSMGKEEEKIARIRDLGGYKVTTETMSLADPEAIFIHCLPADRGYEVEAEVIDGPQSVVWDEAENRLHAQKALLVWLLGKQEASA